MLPSDGVGGFPLSRVCFLHTLGILTYSPDWVLHNLSSTKSQDIFTVNYEYIIQL